MQPCDFNFYKMCNLFFPDEKISASWGIILSALGKPSFYKNYPNHSCYIHKLADTAYKVMYTEKILGDIGILSIADIVIYSTSVRTVIGVRLTWHFPVIRVAETGPYAVIR